MAYFLNGSVLTVLENKKNKKQFYLNSKYEIKKTCFVIIYTL